MPGDKNIVAEAVVAGVPANDVEVHIEDGVLTIKAEVKEKENLPAGKAGIQTAKSLHPI